MAWISSSVVGTAGLETAEAPRIEISNALGRLQKQPRAIRFAVFVILFTLTAWLDMSVDHNLSLFALYLIPTLYSTWYLGSLWAYGSCVVGGVVWLIDDWSGWHSYHHALIPYGNLAGRLLVLAIIVAIVNALKNALEDQYEAERKVVVRELEIASEVQRRLLPSQPPDYPGLDLGFIYRPARELGGDYYDFIPITSERVAVAVGDVSGKGLPSALLMASLQSLVRTNLAMRERKLGRFAAELSELLYERTADDRYATLFLATVDTASMELYYVNAGHNAPLLFQKSTGSRHDESSVTFDKGGPPLGILAGSPYACGTTTLKEGDVLLLYTDGVVDAANAEQEQFGEQRLHDIVHASLFLSATEICQRVADRVQAFTAGMPQWDDITLAVVKVKREFMNSETREPESLELSTL